ncbi:MAG: T9SS type A sorting domain-containing protein, partial [Bacteroidetes bacterium]|nr:T9SS type A sorting domain-containing protein [Bacteroidota bacterium]
TDPVTNVTLKFVLDSRTTYSSAYPIPTRISHDTLMWDIASVNVSETGTIGVYVNTLPPPQVNQNDTLVFRGSIGPVAGDPTPADDTLVLKQVVVSSFDPNDKREIHEGRIAKSAVTAGEYLTYMIRFQNTGTAEAATVTVRDTLEQRLNAGSFEMLRASHAYDLTITDGRFLEWTFPNINLPDSNTNEPGSHGYVVFRIKAAVTVPEGDTIRNTAGIYFDYNLPVQTEMAKTAIISSLVSLPVSILSWNALLGNGKVDLTWQSTFEENVSHYEPERSSDGLKFVSLGQVAAANSRTGAAYQFADAGYKDGNNYYRLKTIDIDGRVSYSNTLLIKAIRDKALHFSAWPNPARGFVSVNLQGEITGSTTISVFDLSGKELTRYNAGKLQGFGYSRQIDIRNLASGLYILQVQSGSTLWQTKLVVE